MKDDGGPAYPTEPLIEGDLRPLKNIRFKRQDGMSLRDRFAIAAVESGQCPFNCDEHAAAARWCWIRADTMITERLRSDEISSNEK